MKKNFKVISNIEIAKDVYKMDLNGDLTGSKKPGQFLNLKIRNYYLRRPISICDINGNICTILYKVVGNGTDELTRYKQDDNIDVLTGLGNGFSISNIPEQVTIFGGGVGIAPLFLLAKTLISHKFKVKIVLGFNCIGDVLLVNEFKNICNDITVFTLDGSFGRKGFVTDIIDENLKNRYFFACGPKPMIKTLKNCISCEGQMSLEERMGCGFGACMGCSIKTSNGIKRVCKDGPVFLKSEVLL